MNTNVPPAPLAMVTVVGFAAKAILGATTTSLSAVEVDARYSVSPPKAAVIECVPTDSDDDVNVAAPFVTVPVPRLVVPS